MCRPTCIVWANPRPCSLQAAVEGATAQRLRLEAAAAAETATEEGQLHRHTELVFRLEDALCFLCLEYPASKLANSDACWRPTTGAVADRAQ
jgi:hypothetical protein